MDTPGHIDRAPPEHPFGELERELIAAYLAGAGQDLETVMARADPESRKLLAQAAQYASEKLSEIEARSHYVRSLHGGA
jgi:hypothetical protein